MIIPNNHSLITSSYEIENICQSLFKECGLSFFMHGRFYDDGTCNLLSNNEKLYRHFFKKNYKLIAPIPEKFLAKKFYYLASESDEYHKEIHDAHQFFEVRNPIDLIERYDGYFVVNCFASNAKNTEIINSYLNNIESLEKFSQFFEEKAFDLITQSKNNMFILPESMKPTFKGIKASELSKFLSKQQTECLYWLIKGMTAKQTAKFMNISHRTVETYIEIIKKKLQCTSRSELIEYGLTMPLIQKKIFVK